MIRIFKLTLTMIVFCCALATAQTPDAKNFSKDNLSFDYPSAWQLQDSSNQDAQQFTLAKAESDVQIRIFVHRGRISQENVEIGRASCRERV